MSGATSALPPFDAVEPFETHERSVLKRRWWERALVAIDIGAKHGTGIRLADLLALLPEEAPSTEEDLARWIADALPEAAVFDGTVFPGSPPPEVRSGEAERADRAERWIRAAEELVSRGLGPAGSLVRCVAVTGSAAYGQVWPEDDLDLLVVTSPGTLWSFLLLAFLDLRLRARRVGGERIRWCLNYAVDLPRARAEYRRSRGFQFAREALTARVVYGAPEYTSLLKEGSWMAGEMPRLYGRRRCAGAGEAAPARPTPLWARLLDPIVFVVLGSYLQAVGLVRNRRLRRAGETSKVFATTTRRSMMAYESQEFRELGELYNAQPDHGEAFGFDDL